MQTSRPVVTELALSTVFQDAWPSPDALSLTFSAGTTPSQVYTATRTQRGDPWTNIVPSSINKPTVNAGGATLTDDQLVIVWTIQNTPGIDIHYAIRDSRDGDFVDGGLMFGTSTGTDFEPSIRGDGCELFFGRALDNNNFDIWSLVATP